MSKMEKLIELINSLVNKNMRTACSKVLESGNVGVLHAFVTGSLMYIPTSSTDIVYLKQIKEVLE
jgi:hypothetical protein